MSSPNGGFFSALDADSPLLTDPHRHVEGAFYLWSAAEIAGFLHDPRATSPIRSMK